MFSPSPPGRANKPRRSQIEISNGILNEVSVLYSGPSRGDKLRSLTQTFSGLWDGKKNL